MSNDQAGTFNVQLSDGTSTQTFTIVKKMTILGNTVEVGKAAKAPIGWLLGPPIGNTPVLANDNGNKFELVSYNGVYYLRVGTGTLSIGSYDVTISCPGAATIVVPITITANIATWSDPEAPIAPTVTAAQAVAGTAIVSGTVNASNRNGTASGLVYRQNVTLAAGATVTLADMKFDDCGPLYRNYNNTGGKVPPLDIRRIRHDNARAITNGTGFAILQGRVDSATFRDFYYQSTAEASEGDIYGVISCRGKDMLNNYGGNVTVDRVYANGVRMVSTASYPNSDGMSFEQFYSQLGPITVYNFEGINISDAGFDCKCPTLRLDKIKITDARESVKNWVHNWHGYVQSFAARSFHIMQMNIAVDESPTFTPRVRYDRLRARDAISKPLVKFEVGPSYVMIISWDLESGQIIAQFDGSTSGAFIVQPDGSIRTHTNSIVNI